MLIAALLTLLTASEANEFLQPECRLALASPGQSLWTKPRVAAASPQRTVLERRQYSIFFPPHAERECVIDAIEITIRNEGAAMHANVWWELSGHAPGRMPRAIRVAATTNAPAGQQSYRSLNDLAGPIEARGSMIRHIDLQLSGDSTATFQAGDVAAAGGGLASLGRSVHDCSIANGVIRAKDVNITTYTAPLSQLERTAYADRTELYTEISCSVYCADNASCVERRIGEARADRETSFHFRIAKRPDDTRESMHQACAETWAQLRAGFEAGEARDLALRKAMADEFESAEKAPRDDSADLLRCRSSALARAANPNRCAALERGAR